MKIDDRNDLNGVSTSEAKGAGGVEGAGRREGSRKAERTGSDRAELSGLAGKISRAVGLEAEQRAANVERLRVAVASGVYNPDPADISRGIVKDAIAHSAAAGGSQEK
jgi:anti-sigma28 factor (negative regulator of flagellin synthesis)